ncbi:MAG: hypothetical protein R3310_09395 [Candidatus Competibacteraceae bacterium]|nr:hypothetical protein [Candidatus Competibacteraceae bacterium]
MTHLGQDPSNNADDNLATLCQRCHNRQEMPQRQAQTRATRRNRRALAELFDPLEGEPQ